MTHSGNAHTPEVEHEKTHTPEADAHTPEADAHTPEVEHANTHTPEKKTSLAHADRHSHSSTSRRGFWKTPLIIGATAVATTGIIGLGAIGIPGFQKKSSSQTAQNGLGENELSRLNDIKTARSLKFLNGMIEAVTRPNKIGGDRAVQSFVNLDEYIRTKFGKITELNDGETFRVIYANNELPHLAPRAEGSEYDIEYAVSTDGDIITITYRSDFPGANGKIISGQIEIEKIDDKVFATVDDKNLGDIELEELIKIVRDTVPGGNLQVYYEREEDFNTPIEEGKYRTTIV